ncbi:MAG: tetratricopeptide repeat protein [Deltaproteobacteria bacterium]|nr:tetratricopeptide repeat protein [Deltaproteobacteria bacterium]
MRARYGGVCHPSRVPDRRPLLLALLLAAATVAVYWPALTSGFVNYDDDIYVSERSEVRAGLSREGVAWAFTSFQGANWFPLTRLSWMLDAELFGLDPGAFHATSLALHVANALLLFLALLRLSGAPWPSAFAAGVFALHPLHVESVAWVSTRKDVVSGLFFMLALLAHERCARSDRRRAWRAVLFALLALGLMAKPMLVTLPCVLLLLDYWPLGRLRGREDLRKALVEKLPLFALAALACGVTLVAQRAGGALQALERYPLLMRIENALDAYTVYVAKAFWPSGLAVFYPYAHGGLPLWRVAIGALLLIGISAWVLRELRRRPYLAVGWLWFVGTLVPVSGLVQVGQAARADRYTYLPLIGLSIMLAWGARELVARRPALALGVRRAGILALAALAVTASLQVQTWRDSTSLFEHALRVTHRNHVAHINLGLELGRAGRFEEAEEHLTTAIAITPASPKARGIRGEVRMAQERYSEAGSDLHAALRLEPQSARWETGLGRVLAEAGRLEAAEAAFRRVLAREPERAEAHALLGTTLFRRGRSEEALVSYRRALALEPNLRRALGARGLAHVHGQLAAVLASRGKREAALGQLERAIRLAPEEAAFYTSQAALLGQLGRESEAAAAYREALRLGDRSPEVLNNLAWLLAAARDPGLRSPHEAVELAREATELTENADPSVLDTLAAAYAAAGRHDDAIEAARRALALAEARDRPALARAIRERLRQLGAAASAP